MARERLGAVIESEGNALPPYHNAMAFVGLGQHDDALAWRDRAADECDPWVSEVGVEPACAPLRDDARFRAVLRRLHLDS